MNSYKIISKKELDELIESKFLLNKKVVLYGAANYGEILFNYISSKNIKIECFSDNDRNKWGKVFLNTLIVPPEKLIKINNICVIISSMYYEVIIEQLITLGLNNIYFCKEFYNWYEKGKVKKDEFKDKYILNAEEGNNLIGQYIDNNKPFMIARLGIVELEVVLSYLNSEECDERKKKNANINAGIFPITNEGINSFSEIYLNSLKFADAMGVWFYKNEGNIITNYCDKNVILTDPISLQPFFMNSPWTKSLKNKKVLVIHPFTESIKKQYDKRLKLFNNEDILPSFDLITIKAVQSSAGCITKYKSWSEALNYMYLEIDKVKFDIALIGAGAYGLPLAAYIKNKGKIAIQMGGVTQILFGIKGKRWNEWLEGKLLYNEDWVNPTAVETPPNAMDVEEACYW